MKMLLDVASRLIFMLLSSIFLKHPTRAWLGMALGGVFSLLATVFAPFLRTLQHVDFSKITLLHWMALAFVIAFATQIRGYFLSRSILDEKIDQAEELIRRGNFSNAERRHLYRQLIQKVNASVASSAISAANTRDFWAVMESSESQRANNRRPPSTSLDA